MVTNGQGESLLNNVFLMTFNVESYKMIGTCGVYCVKSGVNIYM